MIPTRRIGLLLHSNILSGSNISMLRHLAYLANRGHDVIVVYQERFFSKTIDYAGLSLPACYLDELDPARDFDVVLTNWWECAYRFIQLPARRYAYVCHGDERILYDDRSYDLCIDTIFHEDINLFAVNRSLADRLEALSGKPVPVIPNGVDTATSRHATPALPARAQRLRVLVEGRAGVPWKRVPETVAMLKSIDGVEILHVSADGSTDPAWGVESRSGVPHQNMPAIYKSCAIVAKLSAPPESFAMPVLEGFAAGATAVVTDFPGHEVYVEDGKNAIVVPIDDWSAARAAIERLRDDPALLAKLRAAALNTAARFDWRQVSQDFAAKVLASQPSAEEPIRALPLLDKYRQCYLDTLAMKVRLARPAGR